MCVYPKGITLSRLDAQAVQSKLGDPSLTLLICNSQIWEIQ